jgi:hypothetical protein
MQTLKRWTAALLAVALAVGMLACTGMTTAGSTPDPLRATMDGCAATREAVRATDAAVLSGKMSKSTARKTLTGLDAMTAGCNAAIAAIKADPPASGAAP